MNTVSPNKNEGTNQVKSNTAEIQCEFTHIKTYLLHTIYKNIKNLYNKIIGSASLVMQYKNKSGKTNKESSVK